MMLKIILLLTTLLCVCSGNEPSTFVKFQWNYLNFTWPSSKAYQKALKNGSYIPKNNPLIGIKVWKDRMYLTIPRFKNGVPATLVSTPLNPINGNISPLLEPFPNWKMQKLDDCSAFQYVQSMEIDPLGRMWILENGRNQFQTSKPRFKCPAKLTILDLENNNKVLLDYKFPKKVVHMSSVFLNDIVLDYEDGGYAYITDYDVKFPGIIVFSLRSRTSWKITHESMEAEETAARVVVNGTSLRILGATDGIALSPAVTEGFRTLFYCPLSSYKLYSIPVSQLKRNKLRDVRVIAEKSSQTTGLLMTSDGHLYYSLLNQDSVAVWDTNLFFEERTYFQDQTINQFIDTFALDTNGYIYWTTNRLHKFLTNQVNTKETNYRVIASKIYAKGYQYYPDGSAPILELSNQRI